MGWSFLILFLTLIINWENSLHSLMKQSISCSSIGIHDSLKRTSSSSHDKSQTKPETSPGDEHKLLCACPRPAKWRAKPHSANTLRKQAWHHPPTTIKRWIHAHECDGDKEGKNMRAREMTKNKAEFAMSHWSQWKGWNTVRVRGFSHVFLSLSQTKKQAWTRLA